MKNVNEHRVCVGNSVSGFNENLKEMTLKGWEPVGSLSVSFSKGVTVFACLIQQINDDWTYDQIICKAKDLSDRICELDETAVLMGSFKFLPNDPTMVLQLYKIRF